MKLCLFFLTFWLGFSYSADPAPGDREVLLRQRRSQLAQVIGTSLKKTRDFRTYLELTVRLGRIYREEWSDSLGPTKEKAQAVVLDRLILLYRTALKKYPAGDRTDELRIHLAQALLDQNKKEESVQIYLALLASTPKSPYAEEALLQVADDAFNANDWANAEKRFTELARRQLPRTRAYAAYRLGWIAYNKKRMDESIGHFKKALELEPAQTKASLHIREEALHDVAMPLSEKGDVSAAIGFFQRFAPDEYRRGVSSTAEQFGLRNHYAEAVQLWESILSRDPNHTQNANIDTRIIETQLKAGRLFDAMDRLLARTLIYGEKWKHQSISKELSETIVAFQRAYDRTVEEFQRERGNGKNTPAETLEKFGTVLTQFITRFPDHERVPSYWFILGVNRWELKQSEASAEAYARAYKLLQDPQRKQIALRNTLSALALQIDELMASLRKPDSDFGIAVNTAPWSKPEIRFVKIAQLYLSNYPKVPDSADILFSLGELRLSHGEFQEGRTYIEAFTKRFPGHSSFPRAVQILLEVDSRLYDYVRLKSDAKAIANRSDVNPELRREIELILRQTLLKQCEDMERQGKRLEAAQGYVEFARNVGKGDPPRLETALYNASVNFSAAFRWEDAALTQEWYLRAFPKGKKRWEVLLHLAKGRERMVQLEEAARRFEQFALEFPKANEALDAWRVAAVYYRSVGRVPESERAFRQAEKGLTLLERLTELFKSSGSVSRLKEIQSEAVKQSALPKKESLGYLRLVQALGGSITSRLQDFKKRFAKPTEESKILWAELGFLSLEDSFHAFLGKPLVKSGSAAPKELKARLGELKQLDVAYQSVLGTRVPQWSTASLSRLAELYQSMATSITGAPVPAGLSGAELDAYRSEVERTLVLPLRLKAERWLSTCRQIAEQAEVMSVWTLRCTSMRPQWAKNPIFYRPGTHLILSKTGDGQEEVIDAFTLRPELLDPFVSKQSESHVSGEQLSELAMSKPTHQAFFSFGSRDGRVPLASLELAGGWTAPPTMRARELRRKIVSQPDNISLVHALAATHIEMGDLEGARGIWLSLLARGEKKAEVYNNLGVVSLLMGLSEEAEASFREAMRVGRLNCTRVNLAALALSRGNSVVAARFLSGVSEAAEPSLDVGALRLASMIHEGDLNSLAVAAEKLQQNRPSSYARLILATYYLDRLTDAEKAQEVLKVQNENLASLSLLQWHHTVDRATPQRAIANEP